MLGFGVLLWSIFTILIPHAAAFGLAALITVRILMGMGEAVTFPAIFAQYARRIPLRERSRSVAFSNSGLPLGTVFALAGNAHHRQHSGLGMGVLPVWRCGIFLVRCLAIADCPQHTGPGAEVKIAHASPGGKTEQLAIDAISRGLNVLALQSPSNSNLLKMEVKVAPQ